MRSIKTTKFILWFLALLILFLSCYVYTGFNGTPWEKYRQENNMRAYLDKKYNTDFVIQKTSFNMLSNTYQSYAYPKSQPDLLFLVQQDHNTDIGYSDTYPKVYWDSQLSNGLKAEIKNLFPHVDESALNATQIIERSQSLSPNIPTYNEIHASNLACSISINVQSDRLHTYQGIEFKKMQMLSGYLKAIHFPVLIEVHYYEKQIHNNEKVYLITEEGKIVYK